MRKSTLFPLAIILLVLVMLPMFPVNSWIYPDCTSDAKWERWGPRADRILIKLYADDTAEFAALKAGDIDICDWPLSKAEYTDMSENYADVIKIVNYGCEYGLFILDLNSNDNQYLGNPPDPAYQNPVADRNDTAGNALIKGGDPLANNRNPMSVPSLRRAIGHLIDRTGMIADPSIGAGFGVPLYTTMPCPLLKYKLEVYGNPDIAWSWEYSQAKAIAQLEANDFKVNTGTGYRYWDRNDNDIEEPDEYVELIFYIRSDHPGRKHMGTVIAAEMAAVQLRVNTQYATSGVCFTNVMVNKDFHLYTGGWSLGVDPDHLILWSWDWYWHPGFSYNYGGHNDPEFNAAADNIMYSNTQEEAVEWSMVAQYRQCYMAIGIPLYATSGNKAYRYRYCGSETPYAGNFWEGVVNIEGYGIDNTPTFTNMHPQGYPYDDGSDPANPMTIRWGFKVPDIKQLNPIYASWLYDWNVMDQIYAGSLLSRNASDLGEFLPAMTKRFEVSTYVHPIYGVCSKITFTMRTDISWSDGYALTVADVYFTYVELKNMLAARGLPNPWWYSNVADILSFSILDPCTFEVLLRVKSYWAVGWIGGNIVLPKHIWKPIIVGEDGIPNTEDDEDPQAYNPDPNMIGQGPWRLRHIDTEVGKFVELVANRPGRTVQTNLEDSEEITAKDGYYRRYPLYIDVHPLIKFENMTPVWIIEGKLYFEPGSVWHQVKGPEISTFWYWTSWVDNDNGYVDQSDYVDFTNVDTGVVKWHHVFMVEVIGNKVYIKVDWWTQKIPPQYPNEKPVPPTPVEIGVTLESLLLEGCGQIPVVVNKYVYLDGEPITEEHYIPLYPFEHHKEQFNWVLPKCMHVVEVKIHIKEPEWLYCTWINYTFPFWVTVREDIVGGLLEYYDGEPIHPDSAKQIPTPDCKVDIRDIARMARAFGAYPGHERWDSASDINGDAKIDIRDIAAAARRFGWA